MQFQNLHLKSKEEDKLRKDLESSEKDNAILKQSLDKQKQENSQLEMKVGNLVFYLSNENEL